MIWDPEEEIRQAVLLDTILVAALLRCFPARRGVVVSLLAAQDQYAPGSFAGLPIGVTSETSNYCHIESTAILLASQGNALTEALLWLFRSHKQHSRLFLALTEEKCVGVGTRRLIFDFTLLVLS